MGGGHSPNDLGPYLDGCNFFGVIPYLMKCPIILTIKKKNFKRCKCVIYYILRSTCYICQTKGYVNPFINHKGDCKSGSIIIFIKFFLTKYLYYMSVPMPYGQGQWEDYNKFLSLFSV